MENVEIEIFDCERCLLEVACSQWSRTEQRENQTETQISVFGKLPASRLFLLLVVDCRTGLGH